MEIYGNKLIIKFVINTSRAFVINRKHGSSATFFTTKSRRKIRATEWLLMSIQELYIFVLTLTFLDLIMVAI